MKVIRKIIEIDEEKCDGCGQCILGCAEGALKIIDGKARVIDDKFCDGLGACIGECPQGALAIVEREAEEFDEAAVEAHLESQPPGAAPAGCPSAGCPSAGIQMFVPRKTPESAPGSEETASALSHWPVQIRLVPPDAPFLKNADLLVLADCAAVAYPALQEDLIRNKVVLMGCPKFDPKAEYVQRFAEIFRRNAVKNVTVVYMEVPCCSGLPAIVLKGMAAAGATVPVREMVVARNGKILRSD